MDYGRAGWSALALLGVALSAASAAAEKTVAEEILDVLRAQGAISEDQYEDWTQRAQEEREAWTSEKSTAASGSGERKKPLVTWDKGLYFHPTDDIEMNIGGRVYADYAYFDADDDTVAFFGNQDLDGGSGTQFSRARIRIDGSFYDTLDFRAQWDFGDGSIRARDLFMQIRGLPWVGTLRGGHFKEPYSLQRLVSSRHIQFMERSVMNTFATNRNMGFQLTNTLLGERMTWTAGGFIETDETGFAFSDDPNHHIAARLTGLAFTRDEDSRYLHLGFSYLHRFVGESVSFGSKPESNLSPVLYVDTGSFGARHVDQITPELALVWGPFSLQSEYTLALVDAPDAGDPRFHGFYAQAGWFLTGEHRPYNRRRAIMVAVQPRRNFDLKGGLGAWQLGLRYSLVDLTDGAFSDLGTDPPQGRRLMDITAGLNWYLNPYMRVMFNYIRADLDDVGQTNIFQSRMQFDF